jgi:hypothetical protein
MILRPQPGCHLPNSLWPEIIKKLFPARESLVSDVPARDGKIENFFLYSVHSGVESKGMLC